MPVNTAIAFPSIQPCERKFGTRLNAAPTAPSAVMGKATWCGSVKPNKGSNSQFK